MEQLMTINLNGEDYLCSLPNAARNKTAKPKSTATGSKYCTSGALRIRTHGKKLRISVAWSAPATTGYDALAQSKTYRT